jgi:glycosyltransferase involved in cell wall biosynthesis
LFVSVVIPTRNRAAKLRNLLTAIASLDIPGGIQFEVIVADNGSEDDSSSVCAEAKKTLGVDLNRVSIGKPGKSGAANAGIRISRGEIVALLDDDVYPNRDWLTTIVSEFSRDPDLALLCGRVELFNPSDFAISVRTLDRRELFSNVSDAFNLFIGACLVMRRSVLDTARGFDTDFGPGARFSAAEDADLIYRVALTGKPLVYSPQLLTYHDHGRRDADTVDRLRKAYTYGRGAFFAKHVLRADVRVMRTMYWEIHGLLKDPGTIDWRHLTWLIRGFFIYSAIRFARILNPLRWRRGMTGEGCAAS